jgi:long-subunit acyl-CoA synthetase (AMP-forming)
MGKVHDKNQPDFIPAEVARGRTEDVAVMLYTSGTTGKPKGVCQTHETFIAAAQSGVGFDNLTDQEDILSYLPMAWVGDHLFSYAQALVAGFTINCPESGDTVMTDLREIGPTYYFAPPRVFEKPADHGDDPHGGCRRAQAQHVPLLHGGGQALRRRHPRSASRWCHPRIACCMRWATC